MTVQTKMTWMEQRIARRIVGMVADATGVDPQVDARIPAIVTARQVAMALMVQAGLSTPKVGAFFGRDHSTVIHGVRRAEGSELVDRLWPRVSLLASQMGFR